MNELKVCFVGVGSIARRHIRNIRQECDKRDVKLIIDAFRRDRSSVDGIDTVFSDIKVVPSDYDVVFITNPTGSHLETLHQFHEKGTHFFIEKPVVSVDQIEEAKAFILRSDSLYYVACPLRYNSVIKWVHENINVEDVISVRCISSSYLPEWRPGLDYRNTYSAHSHLGGGVAIDLIHEWDYLTYLFGWPKHVKSFIGKKSDLEIDSDDYAVYIAEYEDKIIELHLDYFGRSVLREMQLFMKGDTVVADIANNRVECLQTGEVISFNETRNDFQQKEICHFLDMIEGLSEWEQNYYRGVKVLELTQGRL